MRARISIGLAVLMAAGCTTVKIYNSFEVEPDAAQDAASEPEDGGGAPIDAAPARCAADGGSLDGPTLLALGIDPALPIPPSATTRVFLAANLDVRASLPALGFDVTNPSASSNFPSTLAVYDSLGIGHQLTIYFTKTGTNTWDWHALADGAEIEGGTSGVPFEGASGTLLFNTDGALQAETTNSSIWNFRAATAGRYIAFDFGTPIAKNGTGLDGTTNVATTFTTTQTQQDGYAAGSLTSAVVSGDNIVGTYTNGQIRVLGRCP